MALGTYSQGILANKERKMNYIRFAVISLVASFALLFTACTQTPAPQAPASEETTLTTQAFISQTQTVDSTGDVGRYTSIVLNSLGNPVISYYDGTKSPPGTPNSAGNGDLKLVVCGNPTCSSGNTITTVERGTTIYTDDVGKYNSLVLDNRGFPVISYFDRGNGLMLAKCGNATCTSKSIRKVTSATNIIDTSLVLDGFGYPVIAYTTETFNSTGTRSTAFSLIRCGREDCSIVNPSKLVDAGEYISLALDRGDLPVISYYDARGGDLKVANCDRDCTTKGIRIVDSPGDVGQYSSLVLVTIRNTLGQISGQRPLISYYDVTNGDLKVVYCGNDSVQTVDSSGNVGQYTSLKWNPDTDPTISYYDAINKDLKVVICDPGSPLAQVPTTPCQEKQYNRLGTVDSTGDVGQDNALVVDSNGNPIISYYDTSNQDLKLAKAIDDKALLSATINRSAGQASPTANSPISFTAVFSKDVTGFTAEDVTLSGTAGATTATVSGGPKSYTITVSGMTTSGTVIASFAAGVATDASGNVNLAPTTSTGNSVTYDNSPPTAAPSITDTLGNPISLSTGWYRKQVKVTWNWSDNAGGSGVDAATCTTSTSSASQGEVELMATCNDIAGNQGIAYQLVIIDTVAPNITYLGASPTSPNAKGWYKNSVTVSFSGTDATSGIASCPNRTIGEGLAKTIPGVCTDNAGNRKSLVSPAFNIDKTKPVINVLMNGLVISNANSTVPTYSLAQGIPTASCETTDALSGVATTASLNLVKVTTTGEVAAANPPTAVGTYRTRCSGALDNADNSFAKTVTFKVTR